MKKLIFVLSAALSLILVLFSSEAARAARAGFEAWRDSVLPSLFPFFVCASLMRRSIPKCASLFPICVAGLVSGAPSGARALSKGSFENAAQQKTFSAYTAVFNVISPMFIVGAFSNEMLGVSQIALPILISILLPDILLFAIVRLKYGRLPAVSDDLIGTKENRASLFAYAVSESITAILGICGAMIFFSVLTHFITASGILTLIFSRLGALYEKVIRCIFIGSLEAVSGARTLAAASFPLPLTAFCASFMFAFGGLCIAMQSTAFIKLKFATYISLKLLHGIFAGLIAYFITPIFVSQTAEVFNSMTVSRFSSDIPSWLIMFFCSLMSVAVVFVLTNVLAGYKRRERHD